MEHPLTKNIRPDGEPLTLTEYEQAGGYEAVRLALERMTPQDVQQAVTNSGLRGRGGAGFPTGKKWSFMPTGGDARRPKYLVVNADEMEPGSFKDRLLLEGDPHQMIEGIILGAYAVEAETAYVFLRWAYRRAAERMRQALAEAYQAKYLGRHVMGTDFSLDIHLHMSAGRYLCGEETALLNALEGRRVIPRSKPPYPQQSGLWGRPTIVQNVETLCNVPHIITRGADWYRSLGRAKDGGTKIYGVSGKVKRPGAWELPMGTPAREILEDYAGGMKEGVALTAFLPGGASTGFLLEEHLELPLDFETVPKAGTRLGTGTLIVLDDGTCPVGFVRNLEHFFAQESCGWCTPCRDGLPWVERLLQGLEIGAGQPDDLDILERHLKFLGPGHTYCAHAPGAVEPLKGALSYFRAEFERHAVERRCPWNPGPAPAPGGAGRGTPWPPSLLTIARTR